MAARADIRPFRGGCASRNACGDVNKQWSSPAGEPAEEMAGGLRGVRQVDAQRREALTFDYGQIQGNCRYILPLYLFSLRPYSRKVLTPLCGLDFPKVKGPSVGQRLCLNNIPQVPM